MRQVDDSGGELVELIAPNGIRVRLPVGRGFNDGTGIAYWLARGFSRPEQREPTKAPKR